MHLKEPPFKSVFCGGLSLCLLAGLHDNYIADFHQTRRGVALAEENRILTDPCNTATNIILLHSIWRRSAKSEFLTVNTITQKLSCPEWNERLTVNAVMAAQVIRNNSARYSNFPDRI